MNDFFRKGDLVSIILPVYNGEKYLIQSITSCLAQTYCNLEIIIVDDCSTDSTSEIIREYSEKDSRIKIFNNENNKGLPGSLNVGHKNAKGSFISWTSHDNFFEENAIERLVEELKISNSDVVFCDFNIIDEKGLIKHIFHNNARNSVLLGNCVGACFLYKKEVYNLIGGYNESLHSVEDFDFWLKASMTFKFHHIKEVLYSFRTHSESLSSALSVPNSKSEQIFDERLQSSYFDFFQAIGFVNAHELARIFLKLHRNQEVDVLELLKNFKSLKENFLEISKNSTSLNNKDLVRGIDLKLRSSILNFDSNQNFLTLIYLLKVRPGVLFKYDRKRSLRIFLKCLKP